MRRTVITGIGVLSPLGGSRKELLQGVLRAHTAIAPLQSLDTRHFLTPFGAEVRDQGTEHDELSLSWALTAARRALTDAGLGTDLRGRTDAGVVAGTANGGLRSAERHYLILQGLQEGRITPTSHRASRYPALSRAVAASLGARGPAMVITTACAASTNAIGYAVDLVRAGRANLMLAGGADVLCLATFSGFNGLRAVSPSLTAPFSLPYGMNLGEGAAFWVIEELDHALQRGAPVLAEVLDYALGGDAHHITAPDPRGQGCTRVMQDALARSAVAPEELEYINAHGTGTEANDRAESRGIARLLGERAGLVPVSSTKSYIGHCMGAAGILEATISLVAMGHGVIPPTLQFTTPRPGCALDYVPNQPRKRAYSVFISNSFAFGGNNASVVVARYGPARQGLVGYEPRRVVITGAGAVCSLGAGRRAVRDALARGQRGIGPIGRFDTSPMGSHQAGLVDPAFLKEGERRLSLSTMNPISRYATVASLLALQDAVLRVSPQSCLRVGLVLGTSMGPNAEPHLRSVLTSPTHAADIGNFPMIVPNAVNGHVSMALYLKGFNTALCPGPHAGLAAVVYGYDAIRRGHGEALLAGGCDEVFPLYYGTYDTLGWLVPEADEGDYGSFVAPGSRRVLGEGAAVVMLEEAEAARSRGAVVLAEVLGVSLTMSALADGALDRAIQGALAQGGASLKDVDLILRAPQGNETDIVEQRSLEALFGPDLPPCVTTVAHTGYGEATSSLLTLVAALGDKGLRWPQSARGARLALVVGSSPWGYAYAAAVSAPL